MRGQRIRGRESAFRSVRSIGVAVLLGAALQVGCTPEDREARDEGSSVSPFHTTSEQVHRIRKADFLKVIAPKVAAVRPEPKDDVPSRTTPPGDDVRVTASEAAVGNKKLTGFHRALRALEGGLRHRPVTILHLGDSHIASDRFSGDLREMFQERFGGAGRGLMMPGYPFPYYRARGVRFDKSGKWSSANSFKRAGGLYGLTGVRLTTREKNAQLSLASLTGPFEWAEVSFLTGSGQGSAVVSVDGKGKVAEMKRSEPEVLRVRIEHKGSRLDIRAQGDGPVTVLSWAVGQNRPGVRYINLGIPGATADTPRLWDAEFVAADVARLEPDLIVLGFGTNEGFNDGLDANAYEARVEKLTDDLLRASPASSLAIIGPADSARFPRFAKGKKNAPCRALDDSERRNYRKLWRARSAKLGRWHAPPKLDAVRGALSRVADQRKAHYWDWASAMGGPCAVHDWVRAKPRLATPDHVHITRAGSRRSARLFFASLMEGYDMPAKLASRSGATRKQMSVSR